MLTKEMVIFMDLRLDRKTLNKSVILNGNITYTYGKNTELDQFIPSISPVFGRLS